MGIALANSHNKSSYTGLQALSEITNKFVYGEIS